MKICTKRLCGRNVKKLYRQIAGCYRRTRRRRLQLRWRRRYRLLLVHVDVWRAILSLSRRLPRRRYTGAGDDGGRRRCGGRGRQANAMGVDSREPAEWACGKTQTAAAVARKYRWPPSPRRHQSLGRTPLSPGGADTGDTRSSVPINIQ